MNLGSYKLYIKYYNSQSLIHVNVLQNYIWALPPCGPLLVLLTPPPVSLYRMRLDDRNCIRSITPVGVVSLLISR